MLLPDSRPRHQTNVTFHNGMNWVPIYCANCAKDGGLVPEENCTFAFYLCDTCAEKWSPLADTYLVPDEVFWAKLQEEQLEKYKRILSPEELVELLKDDSSTLAKLGKDKPDFNKQKIS